jgi:hypothetical protein
VTKDELLKIDDVRDAVDVTVLLLTGLEVVTVEAVELE